MRCVERQGDVFDPSTPGASASASTWAVPWSQLAAVLLLVGLALGWRRSRARRRRREAALIDEAVTQALASHTAADRGDHAEPAVPRAR